MPNTLAHFGIQGVVSGALFRNADAKWVFLGCVIPDVPWILQRVVRTVVNGVDPYDLRLYAIAQASFVGCLFLCGVFSAVSDKPRKVFTILTLNVLLHLLLDALQTKWANGVHLFAPVSWELVNFGLFWPESLVTYLLTAFGLGYVAWVWRDTIVQPPALSAPSLRKGLLVLSLLVVYFALPMALLNGPEAADNHFVQTLREREARTGRFVEFDRNLYLKQPARDVLRTLAGEERRVLGHHLDHSAMVSIQARFIDPQTIEISELHEHARWFRDGATYTGLVLLSTLWVVAFFRRPGLWRSPWRSRGDG